MAVRKGLFTQLQAGITACFSILMLNGPATAQQASEFTGYLEEIIVTARRIEENLQDVPMSVAAFSADDLELRGIQRIEDLNIMVPNVQITGINGSIGSSRGSFIIRGIPGVRQYVDGAWIPHPVGSLQQQVVEVERVEVLRGPQGTLFGRDATGGAIRVFTRRPAEEFGARVTATIGEYYRRDLVAALDAPLSDTVKTKWTVASLERDGFIESLNIDRAFGSVDNEILRGDVLWTPNDNFELRFTAEKNDYRSNGAESVMAEITEVPSQPFPVAQAYTIAGLPYTNQTHTAGWPGGEVGRLETKANQAQSRWILETERYVLGMEWAITESLTLQSTTTYNELNEERYGEICACEYGISDRAGVGRNEIFSQELQLHGEHGRVRWVTGAYYAEGENLIRTNIVNFREFGDDPSLIALVRQTVPSFSPPPLNPRGTGGAFEGENVAVFGEATIDITDPLSLTLGLRWFEEDNVASGAIWETPASSEIGVLPAEPVLAHTPRFARPASFDQVTPRVSLQYAWSDNLMAYASYAEGFDSGGTNTPLRGSTELIPYDPQTVETYEVGLRSDWWDHRLRLNVTAFSTDWVGIQVREPALGPTGLLIGNPITNAGAAEAEGLEVELAVAPSESWRFDVALGLLDTRYTDVGNTTSIALDTPFQQAPEKSFSIGVQNNRALGNGGRLTSRLDYGWLDDYVRTRAAVFPIYEEGYGLVNARIAYDSPDGSYRLSLFGTNLANEYYLNSGFLAAFGIQGATVGRPREWGVSLQYFFD